MKTKLLSLLAASFFFQAFVKAQCSLPTAHAELNIGNVRTNILNGGDFWWDGVERAKYEVPKITPNSGVTALSTIFAGGIWLSAKDNNDMLKVSAMTYRGLNRYDFYPGPLSNATGTTDFYTCEFYNQIWEVLNSDIENHVNLANQSLPLSLSEVHPSILYWPAKGNVHITEVNIEDELAPFVDVNANGIYDPENGDFPKVYGDQCLFWVVNDKSGFRNPNHGDPLKVQVQFLAYAYGPNRGILNNTTIYECKVINKSFGNYHDFNFGLYLDYDLYAAIDDFVGCDTLTNTGYAYNSPQTSFYTPIQTCRFLDQDLSLFTMFNSSIQGTYSAPSTAYEVDRILHGIWLDGSPMANNGTLYPGNPAAQNVWSECFSNNPGDRQTLQGTGPHNLNAWESFTITWSLHTIFQPSSGVCPDFDQVILPEIETVKDFYDNKEAVYNYNVLSGLKDDHSLNKRVSLYPNPTQDFVTVSYDDLHLQSLEIFQYDGKLVSKLERKEAHQNLDLSHLDKGIYILQFQFEEGIVVKSLVKE
jgi:hypothetical protein